VSNRRTQQATQQAQPNYYANTTAQQAAHNYYATSQQSQRSTQQYSTNQQAAEQTIYPAAYVSNASTGKKGLFNRLLHRDHDHPHETKAASSPVQAAKNMAYSASKMAGTMQQGVASWYGGKWHGRKTASGERYNQESMTAAHKTLPFGTVVKVTNERNGRECMVRINNRGPFTKGRILDLSKAAARHLGIIGSGVAKVKMEVVGKS
jgi:rare lipoprotein A